MNRLHLTSRLLICLWFIGQVSGVDAARVADLYTAQVPAEGGAVRDPSASFDTALRAVLVKVTGRRGVTVDPVVMGQFNSAESYVQQYRTNPDGTVWVLFDQLALRRALDGIGQPVWGVERPETLVWLVMDEGAGKRNILAAEADVEREADPFRVSPAPVEPERQVEVREILTKTAAERGLPLVLPLVDSEELAIVSISDVWGGFTDSLQLASLRYGIDAILVGRARVRSVPGVQVRWTLILGEERFDWEGDIASGPDRIADFYAARLATSSSALGRMRLRVDGVNTLDDYGRLSRYLTTLDIVEDFSVDRIMDQTMVFSLLVRGDADRLMRSIALRRILQPVDELQAAMVPSAPSDAPFGSVNSGLHYALIAGP